MTPIHTDGNITATALATNTNCATTTTNDSAAASIESNVMEEGKSGRNNKSENENKNDHEKAEVVYDQVRSKPFKSTFENTSILNEEKESPVPNSPQNNSKSGLASSSPSSFPDEMGDLEATRVLHTLRHRIAEGNYSILILPYPLSFFLSYILISQPTDLYTYIQYNT
jgi:hypothetical protein